MARFLHLALLLLITGTLFGQAKPAKKAEDKKPEAQQQVAPDDMVILITGACRTPPLDFAVRDCVRGVTRQEFEELVQISAPDATPEMKQQIADRLGQIIILSNEAKKRELPKVPAIQQYVKFIDMQALANLLLTRTLRDESEKQASDDAVQSYYQAHHAEYETANLLRISVAKKDGDTPDGLTQYAETLRSRCATGEDAAKLQAEANQRAGKPASVPEELKGQRQASLPPNARSVLLLKQGECSVVGPDENQRFVYKLVSRTVAPLEQVRKSIVAAVESDYIKAQLEYLKQQNVVSFNNKYFTTVPAKTAPSPK